MNGTVEEWAAKAEADFATASRELRASGNPNYDAVCFHAQQCVEKMMKAILIHLGTVPPKTHDLAYLDSLLSQACAEWSWPVEELRFVSRAAVAFRYPGESAEPDDATETLRLAGQMRLQLKALLSGSP
ncbi:MAG TPA: HEPN domain-containing protein [Phycisphaerae bacterium]|nr:HEPN domain-containing protein [Phycisphaerae bacterium]